MLFPRKRKGLINQTLNPQHTQRSHNFPNSIYDPAKKRDNEEEKKIKSELAREKKKEKKIKVRQFTFPANFVIMDIEEDVEIPLILGRSFMLTTNCVVDMGKGNLEMSVDDQKVTFNLFEAMKHPSDHKAYFKAEKVEHEVDMVARAMVL